MLESKCYSYNFESERAIRQRVQHFVNLSKSPFVDRLQNLEILDRKATTIIHYYMCKSNI